MASLPGVQPEGVSAGASIVVDLTTGIELYSNNADARMGGASTIKIVTALVARQYLPLEQTIEIVESDMLDYTVFSTMFLQTGDVVTVEVLLQGLLIGSAGDAAQTLARAAGGVIDPASQNPVATFVGEMNAFAAAHGMTNTQFTNPVGIDDPENFISARDLVRATAALLDDPFLTHVVNMPTIGVLIDGPNSRVLELTNSNAFVGRSDVWGVKTGTEDISLQCLVTGFWRGDNRLVTVVLASVDRYADTGQLMAAVDLTYRWLALGIGTVSMGAGDAVAAEGLAFKTRRTFLMPADSARAVTWELVREPFGNRGRQGYVIFRSGERELARFWLYSIETGAIVVPAA